VPAPAGVDGEGWFATFRTNRHSCESDFVLLPADDITAGPVARIPLPHRVPAGLHASWFPA
jgi:carotenoid cleavage dioxygenase-like enzyme